MLIGNVTMSERGIRLHDVDGSHVDITAEQAFDLSQWITRHLVEILEIIRREERAAKEAAREVTQDD